MPDSIKTAEDLFSWWTVMKLALTTGLFTAVFTQSLAWVRETVQDRAKTRRQGQQLALKFVDLLTAYAQECNSRIGHNEYEEGEGGIGRYCDMPDLPAYPEGEGWAALPGRIAAALQDFRSEVTQATRHIKACADINGYPEAIDAANGSFVAVGYQAHSISERLRKEYKFGSYQSATGYKFADELRQRYRKSRRSLLGKVWYSLPVHKLRRAVRKRWRALTKALSEVIPARRS